MIKDFRNELLRTQIPVIFTLDSKKNDELSSSLCPSSTIFHRKYLYARRTSYLPFIFQQYILEFQHLLPTNSNKFWFEEATKGTVLPSHLPLGVIWDAVVFNNSNSESNSNSNSNRHVNINNDNDNGDEKKDEEQNQFEYLIVKIIFIDNDSDYPHSIVDECYLPNACKDWFHATLKESLHIMRKSAAVRLLNHKSAQEREAIFLLGTQGKDAGLCNEMDSITMGVIPYRLIINNDKTNNYNNNHNNNKNRINNSNNNDSITDNIDNNNNNNYHYSGDLGPHCNCSCMSVDSAGIAGVDIDIICGFSSSHALVYDHINDTIGWSTTNATSSSCGSCGSCSDTAEDNDKIKEMQNMNKKIIIIHGVPVPQNATMLQLWNMGRNPDQMLYLVMSNKCLDDDDLVIA